ncbi:MAG: alpha/beta hydrolase [Gemmatimonadota bacterium]|nr:alpha/beta hydrolase [Gemmatimonadota bacterium]
MTSHRLVRVTLVALALTLFGAVAFLLWIWAWQERLVFQPQGPPFAQVDASGGVRRIDYRGEDGQPLFAYVVGEGRHAADTRGVVIAFHGNADLAALRVPWARTAARRTGRVVVLPEWRGYGGLAGRPTVEGVRRDGRAALRLVHDSLTRAPGHVAVYGHSLGSALAAELGAEMAAAGDPPDAVVLESPFSSARAMARIIIVPPVEAVWRLISRVHYDTESLVTRLDAPVWVAHGERDFIIPVRMGREVFERSRRKGELLIVPGAGHNDVADSGGEAYWTWLGRAMGGGE